MNKGERRRGSESEDGGEILATLELFICMPHGVVGVAFYALLFILRKESRQTETELKLLHELRCLSAN